MLLGQDAMEKLNKAHVAVFRTGGRWRLVRRGTFLLSGIGSITSLVDQDTVGESNINRQLYATYSNLGKAKAQVMADRLLDINPQLRVRVLAMRYEADKGELFYGGVRLYCRLHRPGGLQAGLIETAQSRIAIISALSRKQ